MTLQTCSLQTFPYVLQSFHNKCANAECQFCSLNHAYLTEVSELFFSSHYEQSLHMITTRESMFPQLC